jgi:hypothetical protein
MACSNPVIPGKISGTSPAQLLLHRQRREFVPAPMADFCLPLFHIPLIISEIQKKIS